MGPRLYIKRLPEFPRVLIPIILAAQEWNETRRNNIMKPKNNRSAIPPSFMHMTVGIEAVTRTFARLPMAIPSIM